MQSRDSLVNKVQRVYLSKILKRVEQDLEEARAIRSRLDIIVAGREYDRKLLMDFIRKLH